MCGITGVFAFNEIGRFHMVRTHQANSQMEHRGPDAARLFNDYYVGLGHRRLSIIDLSNAALQPMTDATGRYTIVFNGEIYNYKTLKKELLSAHPSLAFHTDSDTEVLLQMFIHFGEDCLSRLHGFFAFAVYDSQESRLFLARDRFGIKPLVYYHDEDKFLFASELGALKAYNQPFELDYNSLRLYFHFHYIPAPNAIYQDVFQLMPGHCMWVKKRDVKTKQWYQAGSVPKGYNAPKTYENAKKQLAELLEQAVVERLVSDVPLGAFLSGGIDSSTVVALAAKHTENLNTFSIGFPNEPLFDETAYAQHVADMYQTNHKVFKLHTDDFFEHLQDLLQHFGQPFADSSALPMYILSKRTQQKVTVALSGDGADEVFAGYHKYMGELKAREGGTDAALVKAALPLLERLPKSRNTFWGNRFRRMHRFATAAQKAAAERYWFLSGWLPKEAEEGLFSPATLQQIDGATLEQRKSALLHWISEDDFNTVLLADMNTLLPNDMLYKVDSMSMAHGLEVRVPFLDHRVVEFAFSLPSEWKITPKMKKRLLQDAVRHLLPKQLYNRPKKGFDVPLARGFRTDLRKWMLQLLDDDFVQEQGLFSVHYTRLLKDRVLHTDNFDQNHVWALLVFQDWWQRERVGKGEEAL